MSGIDDAADAFSADMNGGKAVKDSSSAPAAIDFGDVFSKREIERDEVAGGDDQPTDEEISERAKPRRQASKDMAETDEDADPLYDDPKDPDADAEDDPEEDADSEDDPDDDEGVKEVDLDPDMEVEVTVDGKKKNVSLQEALEGYIRTDTFHTRLNELQDVKKVMQSEARTLIQHRKDVIETGKQLEAELQAVLPAEPDWDKLFAEDATKARGLQKTFSDFRGKLDGIRKTVKDQQDALEAENQQYVKDFATSERQKFEDLPENRHWASDTKKRDRDMASMVKTARDVGFTNEEIGAVLDSRMLAILLRASKYDRLTASRPQIATRGKKPTKPGAGNGPRVRTARKGIGRAQQQLQRSGSVEDAANVFKQLI